jgi:hypothetical protein
MAKAQITEEALAQGIQSLGGFGNLAAKPRRDSPFGAAFAPKKAEPAAPTQVSQEIPTAPPASAATVTEVAPVPQPIAKQVEVVSPAQAETPAKSTKLQTLKAPPPKKDVVRIEAEEPEAPVKADEYTERITLQMTPEMRDKLNELARALQRSRREKGGRITANTLMRVAIQSFIDGFDPKALSGVSSEEELLREVQGKRKSR